MASVYGGNDDRLFYLSGALSFALFFLALSIFGFALHSFENFKSYALTQQEYVAVSLQSMEIRTRPSDYAVQPLESSPAAAAPEVTTPDTPQDVSSLFDDVWTADISKKKTEKKPDESLKRIASIEKRIKTSKVSESTAAADKIASLELVKSSVAIEGSSASAAAEVNEYYAKIQAIIYNNFYPPANSQGNSSKVFLRLDGSGRLEDARVLISSGQSYFDSEVTALLRRLQAVSFPRPPEGGPIELKIILTAKE
jgi:periplasmic protein TonB